MLNDWSDARYDDEVKPADLSSPPRWKRALSAAMVVGAIVLLFLNVRDVVGW